MKTKYYIRYELMCGEGYYMIYQLSFGFLHSFYERWNTAESALDRVKELNNQ